MRSRTLTSSSLVSLLGIKPSRKSAEQKSSFCRPGLWSWSYPHSYTADQSEQFDTDIEKRAAQSERYRALAPPDTPKRPCVFVAYAFTESQPVATGWGFFCGAFSFLIGDRFMR